MKPLHLRLFALLVFATSFVLPAVRDSKEESAGWVCAYLSLLLGWSMTFSPSSSPHDAANGFSLLLSSLSNLLVLAILILSIKSHLRKIRLILVVATVPCFIATWIFFARNNMHPLIGHYLWVTGACLFAAPEILSIVQECKTHPEEDSEAPDDTSLTQYEIGAEESSRLQKDT